MVTGHIIIIKHKKMKNNRLKMIDRLGYVIVVASCFLFVACNGEDSGNDASWQEPAMILTPSADDIELSEALIDEVALTLNWTPARSPGADFAITYLTKLDVADNNFADCILEDEGSEAFSKSYTHGMLQKLLVDKWGRKLKESADMEFRVIGKVTGPRFVKPEVATILLKIKTYGPQVIEAAGLGMAGSAVPEGAALARTIENPYCYAYYGTLNAGTINFPINADGLEVISSADDGTTPIADGQPMDVRVKTAAEATAWAIPATGVYRTVVDLEKKTVAIYSEANDIQPLKVPQTTTDTEATAVTQMYLYGEPSGWGWNDTYRMTQSIANPNIWTYTVKAIAGRTKFGVRKINESYAFSCDPLTTDAKGAGAAVTPAVAMPITGGTSSDQRNSYYKVPAGTNLVVLDLNKMTVVFGTR
jgi:hypothetical protein